ncbi:MAG: hypothetical protein ACI3VN_10820 [Candidatus Onthomonas sp.]
MKKKLTALLLALAMLLSLLTGCGSADAPAAEDDATDDVTESFVSENEKAPEIAEVPPEARQDPVAYVTDGAFSSGDTIMTVNGTDVTADTFVYWMAYQYTYASYFYAQYGMSLDLTQTVDEGGTTIAQSLGDQAKVMCTMNTVLRTKAQEAGVSLNEDQQSGMADLEVNYDENTLLFYGTNLATLQQAYTDSCLASDLQDHLFGEGGEMAPTEQTLADFAEEQGTYTCRYILLATNELDADDETGREEQRLLAEQIYSQLQECSPEELEEKFVELQEQYNTSDGNTSRYTFDASDSLVSGFREKVAELQPGELGMTDETDYGYFVLLRLDTELESLSEDYASATYNSLISEWIDSAQVETTDALDNLDIAACYDRLVILQDALSAQLAAEQEAETEANGGDGEAAGDAEPVG